MTLVLGLASDDDKLIQASAVRALGIYVGYAALKEVCALAWVKVLPYKPDLCFFFFFII